MIAESLLPELDHEMAVTRTLLERLPDDALEWKPHEKSFTLGALATHLVNIPTWTVTAIDQDLLDVGTDFEPPPGGTRDDLLRVFDDNVKAARDKLAGASDETLLETWRLVLREREIFAMPRVAVIRGFVLNHLIHHRGQLTVYLRLKDVPLPSVYGPSADEQGF